MFEHLSERARKVMTLSDEERIRFIRTPWPLSYPRALEILRALEDLLTYPRSHRMPNLLVYGVTNNGKTMLGKRRFKAVLRTRSVGHDDGANTLSIMGSSWQHQKQSIAHRAVSGRSLKNGASLN